MWFLILVSVCRILKLRLCVTRAAGIGLILLLIAVWPANLQMVLNARATDRPLWHETLLWLRLPLQLLLMVWVWRASRPRAISEIES
jgi:uncharacterized membrane protein